MCNSYVMGIKYVLILVIILLMEPVGKTPLKPDKSCLFLDVVFVCINCAVSLSIAQMFDGLKKILGQMFCDCK